MRVPLSVIAVITISSPSQIVAMPVQEADASLSTGDWKGDLTSAPGSSLPLILHIIGRPGDWIATLDSPAQGATGLRITSVVQKATSYRFILEAPLAEFNATLSPDGRTLVGYWTQNGTTIPLTLTKTMAR